MRRSTSTYIVIASAVAMAILIATQVVWLRHAQQLMEESFNSSVNNALCKTVEVLASDNKCREPFVQSCTMTTAQCAEKLDTLIQTDLFSQTLSQSLASYNIDLPYEAKVCSKTPAQVSTASLPPLSCTLDPITATDDHFVNLEFSGQKAYTLERMGVMTGASFFVLLLISLLFLYASYQLLRQQKMGDLNREFFNQMAHEFRTPLTNIKLASGLLARKQKLPTSDPHLRIIQHEAAQLKQQVEQILYLARLESNDYLLQRESTELNQLLTETIRSMQLQVDEKRAVVHFQPTSHPILLEADALHLSNALRNLLDNALKYSHGVPVIQLDAGADIRGTTITITDNGPGLSKEQQHRIFQPYHRCKDGHGKGFGLGLAYVKRVVDLHDGSIQLNSQPGRGCRFTIHIPNKQAA